MPASYRRIDTTDPRRHDKALPFTLPPAWTDDRLDLYESVLSSGTIASGAAMLIRVPALAYLGLLLSVAHAAHYKPLQARKESSNSAGPYTGIIFGILGCFMLVFQKAVNAPGFGNVLASTKMFGF